MKDKELIDEKKKTLLELTSSFCSEKLNEEYQELTAK